MSLATGDCAAWPLAPSSSFKCHVVIVDPFVLAGEPGEPGISWLSLLLELLLDASLRLLQPARNVCRRSAGDVGATGMEAGRGSQVTQEGKYTRSQVRHTPSLSLFSVSLEGKNLQPCMHVYYSNLDRCPR